MEEGKVPSHRREWTNKCRKTELGNHHLGTPIKENVFSKNHPRELWLVGESPGRHRILSHGLLCDPSSHRGRHSDFPEKKRLSRVNQTTKRDTTWLLRCFLSQTHNPNLSKRKHQTDPKWGTFYKINSFYSSKMSRSWKTKTIEQLTVRG